MCSEFNVPCSVLWYRSFFAIGIIALGKQPDIVEDMSALTGRKEFESLKSLKSLKSWLKCSVFNVPCSVLWYRSLFANGIKALGELPDIVEDMSALTGRKGFESLKSLKSLKSWLKRSVFNVPCSVLWYRSLFANGIKALGE